MLVLTATFASACTNSFCNNTEKSRILFALEPGVSTYYSSKADAESYVKEMEEADAAREDDKKLGYTYTIEKVYEENNNLWRLVEVTKDGYYTKSNKLSSILSSAKSSYYALPTLEYFTNVDTEVLNLAINAWNNAQTDKYTKESITKEETEKVLERYGYLKFYGSDDTMWLNYTSLNGALAQKLGIEKCPSNDFVKIYQSNMNSAVSSTKSCIAIANDKYGAYGQDKIAIEIDAKDWGYAWSRGPISGLIVYPVAWLVDSITASIAGGTGVSALSAGWPQLVALIIVTIIVRLFIFGVTFKSTLSQQKMQSLQPELAKIQAKYPNANTSKSEKQRLAEEQMRLYKKNKVNPMSQLLVLFIQFPIFIGVWGAMTGSAALSTGSFLNLNLSTSIWDALRNVNGLPSNDYGWWSALVLFILMAVAQFMAMKVPQWISNSKMKKVARLGVNPAQKQQNKTMKIVSYGMLIMIIIMGFTLPAAMGVYWLVGAIFSLAQSLITQAIVGRKKNKK